MARFFMCLSYKGDVVLDDEGVELGDAGAAIEHAAFCLRDVIANCVLSGEAVSMAGHMSIHDERGAEVSRVLIRDVLVLEAAAPAENELSRVPLSR